MAKDNGTKIIFSAEELTVMQDVGFFDHKRNITQKLYDILGSLIPSLQQTAVHHTFPFPAGTDHGTGRISKGEQYQGLPYIILDFPSLFHKTTIFAFRTLFWWGHGYYVTLHVSQAACQTFAPKLIDQYTHLQGSDTFFFLGAAEWVHETGHQAYTLIDELDQVAIQQQLNAYRFFKLARHLPLASGKELIPFAVKTYEEFLAVLS